VGTEYWNRIVAEMLSAFNQHNYAQGIASCAIQVGDALTNHFPFDRKSDKNELPDNIVFGR
jgi:uncharacterized membrane protein